MPIGSAAAWRYWVLRGWPLWLSIGLFAGGWAIWAVAPHTQTTVRRVGLGYELIGVTAVLIEFVRAMKRNGLLWPWVRLWRYIKDIPITQRVTQGKVGVALGSLMAAGYGESDGTATVTLPIEQRIEVLERAMRAAREEITRVDERVTTEEQARTAAIEREASQRAHEVARLTAAIREIEVGNLSLSLFGLLWLMFGMLMTTGTEEVCAFVLSCLK